MTGFVVELDNDAAAAAEEAAAGGNGTFPPLPQGKYQARVAEVVKVEDFGGHGGNANKKVVRIKLQIFDNSPTGARRIFFVRIPLFSRYAPNQKNPQGAVARAFWDFWEKAMEWPREQILAGSMPGPNDITGKPLTITLGAPQEPDQYNPLGSNEVDFFDVAGDVSTTPQTPVRVPWLDDFGNLNPSYVSQAQRAQAAQQGQAAPSAPPAWNQPAGQAPAAPQAPQAPAGAPAWQGAAQPAAAQAAPAGPPAWQPAAADVAYAQQAAGGLQAAAAQASGY